MQDGTCQPFPTRHRLTPGHAGFAATRATIHTPHATVLDWRCTTLGRSWLVAGPHHGADTRCACPRYRCLSPTALPNTLPASHLAHPHHTGHTAPHTAHTLHYTTHAHTCLAHTYLHTPPAFLPPAAGDAWACCGSWPLHYLPSYTPPFTCHSARLHPLPAFLPVARATCHPPHTCLPLATTYLLLHTALPHTPPPTAPRTTAPSCLVSALPTPWRAVQDRQPVRRRTGEW